LRTVSEVTEPTLTNASSSISIVDTARKAGSYEQSGNLQAAATEYADYATRPDALWHDVLFATQMIERLGVFNKAIEVFEWSQTHPKTGCFTDLAASEIVRLSKASEVRTTPAAAIPSPAATGSEAMGTPAAVPAANKIRYETMYADLQKTWKAVAEANLKEFFFNQGVEKSELTSTAILELMYGFLIEHPEVHIPDLENFGLFTIANYNTTTQAVTIPQLSQLKNKVLNQALAAFETGKKLYATIVQVGGAGSGHYTLVVIERDGKVHMINTMGIIAEGLAGDDPYVHIMPELVKALNTHKGTAPIVFTAASNVRTGIQDADAGSNSCGIYSFVYWAELMMTQDINAYKRVTAAAAEGYLSDYEGILKAAIHTKAMDAIVQVDDLSKANEFGIRYFKNPNAEVQTRFELDVRDRLQLKLTLLAP